MKTPAYLGPIHHPAVGIRIPEVFLEGILSAFKEKRVAGTLMLSFVRETAPEDVINAPPGVYEVSRGHTGTSIRKYLTMGAEAARAKGVLVEMEADHITITTSPTRAVKRISGAGFAEPLTEEEYKEAMEYVKREVDEAVSTGYVNFFTVDGCELIEYKYESMSPADLNREFDEVFGEEGKRILERYVGKTFKFITARGRYFYVKFDEERVMRLALKYRRSIGGLRELVGYIRSRMGDADFGLEVAFDETPSITRYDEFVFYLNELKVAGIEPDFVAPNVGFEKRVDYTGDLSVLGTRVEALAAIARAYGALLSFHSGSGSSPYGGKGKGVYETLLGATGAALKYKVSGVYFELLMDVLYKHPKDSRQFRLFTEIYDSVYRFIKEELEKDGPLASPALRRQVKEYERNGRRYDPRAQWFRYYSFLALNLRDKHGRRPFREALVEMYEGDTDFKATVDREVKALTLRLIDGLKFEGNISNTVPLNPP